MNTWQKCPVCDGSGSVFTPLSSASSTVCPTCKGARIISTINGLPPAATTERGDFEEAIERAKRSSEYVLNQRPELRETLVINDIGLLVPKPVNRPSLDELYTKHKQSEWAEK